MRTRSMVAVVALLAAAALPARAARDLQLLAATNAWKIYGPMFAAAQKYFGE